MKQYHVSESVIGREERKSVDHVLASNWLTQGETVAQFERDFAAYLRVRHAVMCSTGTAALHLALAACGIGPGDEVLVPDLTYVATANAVAYTGAVPILVDIESSSWNISLKSAESKITQRTRAIIPVHLYGVPCDMKRIDAFAGEHRLLVIEDAAEALGAKYESRACGTHGNCGTFSFYANKVMTTGEGGIVVTNDKLLADRLRLFRGQGQGAIRYRHEVLGFNYRATEVQAAIGCAQLRKLPQFLAQRQIVQDTYTNELFEVRDVLSWQAFPEHGAKAPWMFTVRVYKGDAQQLMQDLQAQGVETRPSFVPLHQLPMYAQPNTKFVNSTFLSPQLISLPTHPKLTEQDVRLICKRLKNVLRRSSREN